MAEKAIIIAEKPSVAQRIAKALGGKLEKKVFRIPIYNVRLPDGSNAKVIPVAGHIIEHDFPIKKWVFPVMVPPEKLVLKVNEEKEHFLKLLRDEGRNIDTVIVATDLDSEGSAIALEIIKYLRWDETKKIKRAVFSSTKLDELRRAFENLQPFDYPRAMAGWSRSVIDLLWGANITRGLTISTRNYGDVNVRVISGGRVQSAALKLIVDREKEIREFKPRKYYVITGRFRTDEGREFDAILLTKDKNRIWDRRLAYKVAEGCKKLGEGEAKVTIRRVRVQPPPPYDGTTMQVEVARITGLTPRDIADRSRGVAQRLYEGGLISYIGTESQKWPKGWNRKNFIEMLKIIEGYNPLKKDVEWVLKNMRKRAVEGKKEDPAHPAIHIVGNPESSGFKFPNKYYRMVYEIIARRVLASLSPDGLDERTRIDISMGEHVFRATGTIVVEEGWRTVWPYCERKEVELPKVNNGEVLKLVSIKVEEKETQPPARYTPVTLIKEMARLGLGTKNTRAQILDILEKRGYVTGSSFKPTALGMKVVEILENNVPEIISPEMTSQLDKNLTDIELEKIDPHQVMNESYKKLNVLMKEFEKRQEVIGSILGDAFKTYRKEAEDVGICPKCKGKLLLKKSRYGFFVICNTCGNKYHIFKGEKLSKRNCSCGLPLVSGSIKTKSGRRIRYTRCLGNCEKSPLRCSLCSSVARPLNGRYGVFLVCSNSECGATNYIKILKQKQKQP